jgi:hypothetical protein
MNVCVVSWTARIELQRDTQLPAVGNCPWVFLPGGSPPESLFSLIFVIGAI